MNTLYPTVKSRILRFFLFLCHLPFHTTMLVLHIAGALIQAVSGIAVGTLGVTNTQIGQLVTNVVTGARAVLTDLALILAAPTPVGKLIEAPALIGDVVHEAENVAGLVQAIQASPAVEAQAQHDAGTDHTA